MSSFGGRFGGLTLPPNAIETSAPESGTRRTGGSLPTPDGPRVGLTAPGVTASNGDFSAAQRAADLAQALSGLAGAVDTAGQVAAQNRAEARRAEAEDEAAEALMRAQGVTAAQNELPRITADIAAGRIARQGDETDEQLIERVMAERTANMSEAEAIGYRARATPVLLENSIRATEEAAKTARVEIGQQMNDLAMTGAMSGDRGLIDTAVRGYMATFRVSQAQAEQEVVVPAMMRAAELGQDSVVRELSAVLGPDRFVTQQQYATAKLDEYKAQDSRRQAAALKDAVSGALNDYSIGAISATQLADRIGDLRRSGVSESDLRPAFNELEQIRKRETEKAERAAQQARFQEAQINVGGIIDQAITNTDWAGLPPEIPLVTRDGTPILDERGAPRMVSTAGEVRAAVERRGRSILNDQSVPPEERITRLNTWLSSTGLKWEGLTNMIASGANAQLGTTDQPSNPEAARSFTNALNIYQGLGPAVQMAHTDERTRKTFDAVIRRMNSSSPITPAGLAQPPENQVVDAWRQVADAKARGVDLDYTPKKLDERVSQLTNTSWALAFWQPDDANQTDLVRSALIREWSTKRLGYSNEDDAWDAAVTSLQENWRLVGPDLAPVNDPRIRGSVDMKAELFNRVGTSMAKQFIKDNPAFSRSNGDITHKDFYLTPVGDGNVTDQWQLVYRTDDNMMGTTGRTVTISDLNAMLNGMDAGQYIFLQDAKKQKVVDKVNLERQRMPYTGISP